MCTSVSFMFGVARVKRNIPQGHTTLSWKEQMLQTRWVIKTSGAITATSSIFKDFYGIGCALTFFTLWKGASWGPPGPPKASKVVVFGEGNTLGRATPIWEPSKSELFAYYLPQNNKSGGSIWNAISFPPLSAPTLKKLHCPSLVRGLIPAWSSGRHAEQTAEYLILIWG